MALRAAAMWRGCRRTLYNENKEQNNPFNKFPRSYVPSHRRYSPKHDGLCRMSFHCHHQTIIFFVQCVNVSKSNRHTLKTINQMPGISCVYARTSFANYVFHILIMHRSRSRGSNSRYCGWTVCIRPITGPQCYFKVGASNCTARLSFTVPTMSQPAVNAEHPDLDEHPDLVGVSCYTVTNLTGTVVNAKLCPATDGAVEIVATDSPLYLVPVA